jgi:hypothetical protein
MKNKSFLKTTKIGWAARILGSVLSFIWLFIIIPESIMEYG